MENLRDKMLGAMHKVDEETMYSAGYKEFAEACARVAEEEIAKIEAKHAGLLAAYVSDSEKVEEPNFWDWAKEDERYGKEASAYYDGAARCWKYLKSIK